LIKVDFRASAWRPSASSPKNGSAGLRLAFGHPKDKRAFQPREFFALCPAENSWQIEAMNAKRKFPEFVILLLASGILVQAMEFA